MTDDNQRIKVKVCFIILHYINIELTKLTIDSILKLDEIDDTQIIVVDNASPNKSSIDLKRIYNEYKKGK